MLRNVAAVAGGLLTCFILQFPTRVIWAAIGLILIVRGGTPLNQVASASFDSIENKPIMLLCTALAYVIGYFAAGYVTAWVAVSHRTLLTGVMLAIIFVGFTLSLRLGGPHYPHWFKWAADVIIPVSGFAGSWFRQRRMASVNDSGSSEQPPIAKPG